MSNLFKQILQEAVRLGGDEIRLPLWDQRGVMRIRVWNAAEPPQKALTTALWDSALEMLKKLGDMHFTWCIFDLHDLNVIRIAADLQDGRLK